MGFFDDFDEIILSPNNAGSSGSIVALCFHSAKAPERFGMATSIAQWFQRPSTAAATTGVFDNKTTVGCVPYGLAAWHTGAGRPWNGMVEGYEHAGYARQTRQEWLDGYGIDMLDLSARHFAKRCADLGIPPRKINEGQLLAAIQSANPGDGGICGHIEITRAARVVGGHWDPGPNFPWDYYISRVRHFFSEPVDRDPTNPNEDIMATRQELQADLSATADRIITAVVGAVNNARPPDDKWMGTHAAEGRIYIVEGAVKFHVPGSTNPDPADAQAENNAKIATLEFLGFENRGVQDQALSALPEQAYGVVVSDG